MSDKIGKTKKEAQAEIERLLKRKEQIRMEMHTTTGLGSLTLPLELSGINEAIIKVRDEYSLGVLESLENETRTLKWLTAVLIGLTVVLAVLTGLLALGIRFP